ncbi:FAD-binding oxidoreductase [Streptomyces uncialis]|uniref:FAD-binding oxidoreductase n=1 Tax=Streptomyces uncialis TaxID=1048205 RepID=UPI000AFC5CF7
MTLRNVGTNGVVLGARDSAYARETSGFQTGFTQRPEQVRPVASVAEVVGAITHAREAGLPVRVRATGHGTPGNSEGGMLISTRRLDEVRIDPHARVARIGAGARWSQVIEAAAPHGLAPLSGSSPGVGAVSYTLGGGLGLLGRSWGYAADHVRSVDLVTAGGERLRVTADSEPELFWGLRGAGHGFGVVTALETGLVPVTHVYGGGLSFDGRETDPGALLRAWTGWTAGLPDAMSSTFAALPFPDAPMLPPALRGRYTITVRVAYTGDPEEGARLMAPLRAVGPVTEDTLRTIPYTGSGHIHDEPDTPHAYYGDNAVVRDLDPAAGAELLALTGPDAPGMTITQITHLGGALGREPAVPNAVPYREGRFLVRLLSMLQGTDPAAVRAHYARVLPLLAPSALGRSLNFAFGDADGDGHEERARALYGAHARGRLAGLKKTYDPTGLFVGSRHLDG